MDGTREADLERLHRIMHDPEESDRHKRQAHRAFQKIRKVASDPFITAERARLIRANQAGDAEAAKKISLTLADYQNRHYPDIA